MLSENAKHCSRQSGRLRKVLFQHLLLREREVKIVKLAFSISPDILDHSTYPIFFSAGVDSGSKVGRNC